MKSSKQIRQLWIDFFVSKGHLFLPSKSLIPQNDPSLLWVNSGVATLKDFFAGKKKPPAPRLVNAQKALRTNDIENVGITARHHTFFEMLGNFSIGDYFKDQALEWAHEFLTQVLKLDQNRLYITYFEEDQQVRNKWLSLGYHPTQLIPGSKALNFWDLGSGPCGPNTEIFYDRGPQFHPGGPELIANDLENDRFIEIWNIVFSELNNNGDGTYTELAQKNIDTGAGLERIVSILQNGPTNFDTDLFLPIIQTIEDLAGVRYDGNNYFQKDRAQDILNKHFKIIADHMRAVTNAIGDGEKPSNTQRGYIIRRLIRRAYYSGTQLGIRAKAFLYQLVPVVVQSLIFTIDVAQVQEIVRQEELAFAATIDQGQKLFNQALTQTTGREFDVQVAFRLYETFGFPIEMTHALLAEHGLELDLTKLQALKAAHIAKSRTLAPGATPTFARQLNALELVPQQVSQFIGYDQLVKHQARILFLLNETAELTTTAADQISYLILDQTPFYATSGGQLHDRGYLQQGPHKVEVLEVFKDKHHNHVHVVRGRLDRRLPVDCYVDEPTRWGLMRNHSATHLTFAALRHVYGRNIEQLGSDNNQHRLLFDFPLDHKPTAREIEQIEAFVCDVIRQNVPRKYIETTIAGAKQMNAIMTIAETEYLDANAIRIVEFPGITADLCGGTHIDYTGNLEAFKITNVESKGTGIFRIRAITSHAQVHQYLQHEHAKYQELYTNLAKKYHKLRTTKQTTQPHLTFTMPHGVALAAAVEMYKEWIAQLSAATRALLKCPDQIRPDHPAFTPITHQGYQFLVALDVDKNYFKTLAIQTREAHPDCVVVVATPYTNGQMALVISSKSVDVKSLLQLTFFNQLQLRGGGNQLIWQGVATRPLELTQWASD